jgi:hypothetical protein
VVARRALRYDAALARLVGAPWVRAGSGLVRFGKRLLVIQDDALWLAWLDETGALRASALASDGPLLFDDKRRTPDFEAVTLVGDKALVFGSGSLPSRERIAVVEPAGTALIVEARELYQALRAEPRFAGSRLNIEGAFVDGQQLVLCTRDNGEGGRFDATMELPVAGLLGYLASPSSATLPALGRIDQYALGSVDGVRLTLTDAALRDGRRYYLAAAEATPDAIADGPVLGASIGLLAEEPRYALLESEDGAPLRDKVEGLTPGTAPGQWLALVDADDPARPAELLTLETEGL